MRSLRRRIEQLEHRSGFGQGESLMILATGPALALDADRCVEILKESGHLRQRPNGASAAMLVLVPEGLDRWQLEAYLRERGDEICS